MNPKPKYPTIQQPRVTIDDIKKKQAQHSALLKEYLTAVEQKKYFKDQYNQAEAKVYQLEQAAHDAINELKRMGARFATQFDEDGVEYTPKIPGTEVAGLAPAEPSLLEKAVAAVMAPSVADPEGNDGYGPFDANPAY